MLIVLYSLFLPHSYPPPPAPTHTRSPHYTLPPRHITDKALRPRSTAIARPVLPRAIVIDMSYVRLTDVTGLTALSEAMTDCRKKRVSSQQIDDNFMLQPQALISTLLFSDI